VQLVVAKSGRKKIKNFELFGTLHRPILATGFYIILNLNRRIASALRRAALLLHN
jgi:hypothetical protein